MMADVHVGAYDALNIHIETAIVSKYPAKQHARSVAKHLGVKSGLIYLLGTSSKDFMDSDQPTPFRQGRFFYYLSGVDFENCIITYDIAEDDLRLFIPPILPWEIIWRGPTPSIKECEDKYDVDHVYLKGELNEYILGWLNRNVKLTIYILHKNQGPRTTNLEYNGPLMCSLRKSLNWTHLKPAMEAARVIKSDHEVELIRRANNITSYAHRWTLSSMRREGIDNETQIEAAFQRSCLWMGAKKQAYGIIVGSGTNASTLHYVANNQPLAGRQLVCMDAGCEWECYASDVTRTFPISGTFSDEATAIYSIVAEMQDECIQRIKPGVIFRHLHNSAMEIAVRRLASLGILHNGTFEEMLPSGVAFFPHGLGHHLGLECHDVQESQRLLHIDSIHDLGRKSYLSIQKPGDTPELYSKPYGGCLATNMVITVEPGIYFSRYALEQVYLKDPKHAKYINADVLERYYPVGGVRIEDDILVTATGYENLTTAPKGEEACRIIRGEDPVFNAGLIIPRDPRRYPSNHVITTCGYGQEEPPENRFLAEHDFLLRYLDTQGPIDLRPAEIRNQHIPRTRDPITLPSRRELLEHFSTIKDDIIRR